MKQYLKVSSGSCCVFLYSTIVVSIAEKHYDLLCNLTWRFTAFFQKKVSHYGSWVRFPLSIISG